MKILQVTPFYPPDVGGISDHVFNVVKNLRILGNDVTVITPHRIFDKGDFEHFHKTIRIPSIYLLPWPYSTLKNFSFPIDLGTRIDQIIKNGNFDIVHTHGQHYPTSWISIRSSKKYGIPCILTIHTTFALNPKKLGGKTLFEVYFNKFIFSRLVNNTSGVIGLTESNINFAKEYAKPGKDYFQIPNGIDNISFNENRTKREIHRNSHGINDDDIIVLFCGRFEDVKGIFEFAKASALVAKKFETVRIIIIGNGSLKTQIFSIVGDEPKVNIIDWQPHDKLVEYYSMSDIFVIPSKFEGLPIVLLEAMAASMHILYTPVGSMPEVLRAYPKKTMIRNCTVKEIYDSLCNLLDNFGVLGSISKDSNELMERFDWKNITKQIEISFREIIDKDMK